MHTPRRGQSLSVRTALIGLACLLQPALCVRTNRDTRWSGGGGSASAFNRREAPAAAADFNDGDDATIRNHWAVLIAGSSGWGNYRHQADVCHAYQVLLRGGLRPARMVVMMYDDIATSTYNPTPGKVFNSPGGPDVYGGVRIDYRGQDVTAATFLAVLEGNASAVAGVGSGRVAASGPHDRLFVFYSDHGAPGVLGMPAGSFLYADDMVAALQRKHRKGGYKEAVLYIEACESGSMFEGVLPDNISVYATTASNAFESSWGTYCPGMDPSPPPAMSTCLGDLYSVAWMENADDCDLTHETLMAQYQIVRLRTSNNFTYSMGSHVMQYGSLDMTREVAGDYQGMRNRGGRRGRDEDSAGPVKEQCVIPGSVHPSPTFTREEGAGRAAGGGRAAGMAGAAAGWLGWLLGGARVGLAGGSRSWGLLGVQGAGEQQQQVRQQHYRQLQGHRAVEQRQADLVPLRHRAAHGASEGERREAEAELSREVARRRGVDATALLAAEALLRHPDLSARLAPAAAAATRLDLTASSAAAGGGTAPTPAFILQASAYPSHADLLSWAAAAAASLRRAPAAGVTPQPPLGVLAAQLTHGSMGRLSGQPVVDDWGCLRAMVAAWADTCGPMDQYGMRHTRLLANLCNAGVDPGLLPGALREAAAVGAGGLCGSDEAAGAVS